MQTDERQLGEFIRGRLAFIQHYCEEHGLEYEPTLEAIYQEARRLAGTPERELYLEERFFKANILSTSYVPDWVDKVLLEAMTYVLKGRDAPLYTTSSDESCIPFEAGRFNARRQAESVFKVLFSDKTPEKWLRTTFRALYKQCYGDEASHGLKSEQIEPRKFNISLAHKHLEKASPMDCSTIIGYIYGSLETLGAKNILIRHDTCATLKNSHFQYCEFIVTWEE